VQQGWVDIFLQIGPPSQPPQPRGKSPGWPKGKRRRRKQRYPVVKKSATSPSSTLKTVWNSMV